MISQLALLAVYGSPAIRLSEVCETYFGLGYEEALRRAALNQLPVPTFRLNSSRKAPLMVSVEDLGKHIDAQSRRAKEDWQKSQVN